MPRIRTVKPEFWKSEKVASRLRGPDGRAARTFFVALWNFAEDHGVARGHPGYLRGEIFPYDDDVTASDVARWLDLLEAGGFIVRFARDGSSYIWIRGFQDHQKIDRPSKPTLPEPTDAERDSTSPPRALVEPSASTPRGLAAGKEGKGEEGMGREGNEAAAAAPPSLPPDPLQDVWNQEAHPDLPRWKETGPDRKRTAKARLKERPLEEWREIIRRISASDFCRGLNDRGWRASPDWLLQPATAAKVLEGKYDNRKGTGPPPKPGQRVGAEHVSWDGVQSEISHEF